MKKFMLVIALMVGAMSNAFAARQNNVWTGTVLDENGEPLPYANVVLLSMPDSTVISGVVTELDGTYSIASDATNAKLMVAMIGYDTFYTDKSSGVIVKMVPSTEMLGAAAVTAVMPKTKLTDQGLLTSVKGSVLETVGTARDALSRVPGLIKGQNGLEVLGKGAPLIYINGRRVQDASELDRLQSNEIQSVEVITNPGAQYSASIRAVVRIKTVKHQGDGFGFNAGAAEDYSVKSHYLDPSGYFNANYRHNGLDVFAGVNATKYSLRQESDMLQQTFGDPGFKQEGTLDYQQKQKNVGFNGGFNWQISDNHSAGVRVETSMDPSIDVYQIIEEDIFRGNTLVDHLVSEGNHHNDGMPLTFMTNAYYNGTVGKLNIDFNMDYYKLKSSQNALTDEKSEQESDDKVNYISHSNNNMYAAKLVLTYPIWAGALQAGTEDIFTRLSDDYTINSSKVPSSKSNVSEDNMALFANYGAYIPKVGQFSAGLRYEHVEYAYDDLAGTNDFSRTYDNLFPTFSYANAFGPVQMQFSYTAKTTRPSFESLNSSIRYHSRYIFQSGNNKLQPQRSHDFGFNVNWNFLTMVTQYSHVNDAILSWSELYNDEGVVIVHPVNIDNPYRVLAWYLNAAPTIGIWTLNYTAGVQQQWLTINCPDPREATGTRDVSFNDKPMWVAQLYNTFSFKKGWRFELGTEYHSKAYSQNGYITNTYFNLSAAIQKSLLNDSLVIRLEGSDLTRTGNYDIMTDCGSHLIKQTNYVDSQKVKLSVRYNFNTAISKYKGTGAGQDVKARIK